MKKTYNEIVSALQELARDGLRMIMINTVRTELLSANNELEAIKKDTLRVEKEIAILDYKATKLDEADPEFEDKTKAINEMKEHYNEHTALLAKEAESCNKNIAAIEAKIVDITEGKIKVNMDTLETETDKLVNEVIKAAAVEAVKQ